MSVFTVTLYPYLESIWTTDSLISGRVNPIACTHSRAMGGGVAAGRVLTRLRLETYATGLLGRINAGEYLQLLGDRAGESDFVLADGRVAERTLLRAGGSRLWLEREGTAFDRDAFDELTARLLRRLQPDDVVVLCGQGPSGEENLLLPQERLARFCRKVRSAGGRVVADGIFTTLGYLHYARPETVVLSAGELGRLTGVAPTNPLRLRTAMAMTAGHTVDTVLIPCGGSTISCLSGGRMTRGCVQRSEPAVWPCVVTTCGCLAAWRSLAGYAAGIAQRKRPDDCLKLACSCVQPELGRGGRWGKKEIVRTTANALVREWKL